MRKLRSPYELQVKELHTFFQELDTTDTIRSMLKKCNSKLIDKIDESSDPSNIGSLYRVSVQTWDDNDLVSFSFISSRELPTTYINAISKENGVFAMADYDKLSTFCAPNYSCVVITIEYIGENDKDIYFFS